MEVNNTEKSEKEQIEKFKSISIMNSAAYSKPKKVSHGKHVQVNAKGETKTKYIRTKEYENGVVKNEISGLSKVKDGKEKMIFGSKE